ncbi:FMN-dependent 2-nitropropane dioxygenase [Xylariaceae sp. AK1471]|nr:FMN-dependent 2-nitropropane dioxygenase [Xylariaceae sp. AK1471]
MSTRFGIIRKFTMSAAPGRSRMQHWFPGTTKPLVVSAPMAFVSNPKLATEVVRANGLGFIQGGRAFKPNSPDLSQLEEQLTLAKSLLQNQAQRKPAEDAQKINNSEEDDSPLPIGVGFVLFSDCAASHFGETAIPILARHRPAAVWLFAPNPERPDTLRRVTESLLHAGSANWSPRIVVQVGTVSAAREAAELGAHVVVAQGVDAGGHQFARGAGVVSLVPEVRDMLRDEFPDREVAVWAAGGIADGRGVAAALALGAEAAVLGTRYMVATESGAQDYKRKALISASDGGANTVKSHLHDHVQGNRSWPAQYDARALVHPSYHDHQAGMGIEENETRYRKAKEGGDVSMMVTWSGSGVGLIRTELPAAEITKKVRDEAVEVIRGLTAAL